MRRLRQRPSPSNHRARPRALRLKLRMAVACETRGGASATGGAGGEASAAGKGLSPQTLMYAYVMALGHTPLSGTKDPGHMREDVDVVLRFQRGERVLNDGEMEKLSSLLGIPGHSEAN